MNDFLNFSDLDGGGVLLDLHEFDLQQTLEEAVEAVGGAAERKGVALLVEFDPAIPGTVIGDAPRVQRILRHLLSNALKFTDSGHVAVALTLLRREASTALVRFEVSDSGPGIAPEDLSKLFEPFQGARSGPGPARTRLGLAVCHRLVTMMAGQIGVESPAGGGSLFWLEIPMAAAGRPAVPFPGGRQAVLVVAGGEAQVRATRQCERWGIHAVWRDTLDGDWRGVDYLVIDMQDRPKGDVERAIARARLSAPGLTVVALLNRSDGRSREDLQGPAFDHVLRKPLLPRELLRALMSTRSIARQPRSRGRILLAEDNRVNQKVATHLLAKLGYESEVVANGVAALQALEEKTYDAVLMDCHMPEMDGYQTTEEIRRRSKSARVPVIAVTACALAGDREKCLAAGMDDYVTKPIHLDQLERVLARWVTGSTDQFANR